MKDAEQRHLEAIGDLLDVHTRVLMVQTRDPDAFLTRVKPGPQIGSGPSETGGLHRILCVQGHYFIGAECVPFLEMPQYVDENGTNYVEVTRGEPALPVIPADGHCLIAAAYYLRWQKPISSDLIGYYRAKVDRLMAEGPH